MTPPLDLLDLLVTTLHVQSDRFLMKLRFEKIISNKVSLAGLRNTFPAVSDDEVFPLARLDEPKPSRKNLKQEM